MGNGATAAHYRSLFISDLHLGSYRSNVRGLERLLATVIAETVYLVGDVIDFWGTGADAALPPTHRRIMERLCELARRDTRIVLVPGNHDAELLHAGQDMVPGIEIHRDFVVRMRDGRDFLLLHGHEQDPVFGSTCAAVRMTCGIVEKVGSFASHMRGRRSENGVSIERPTARTSRDIKSPERVSRVEASLIAEAKKRGVDGVICGHTHAPADRHVRGIHYMNCGDWLGNCTAITEAHSGELALRRWCMAGDRMRADWRSASGVRSDLGFAGAAP